MIEMVYIGTYSNSIKVCEFNDGNLKVVDNIGNINNPSYLNINKDILYAVSETEQGRIETFKITNGRINRIDSREINQNLPCYINTDNKRKHLLVANYKSGSVIMYDLDKIGRIYKEKYRKTYINANMHFANFIGKNIYAVDLGNDSIYVYDNKMKLLATIETGIKCGPRHLVISKDEKRIYVVTELSNELLVYQRNGNEFKLIQRISTLINKNVKSYAGAIKISDDNKNIYVTNRGDNSISVFYINDDKVELIQNIQSYGEFPRDILLNREQKYMMVANQNSNNITIYKRNFVSGRLHRITNKEINVDKPSCIIGG